MKLELIKMEKLKTNKKYLILGLVLPLIGIIFCNLVMEEDKRRSLRKGSAISTLVIFFIVSCILVYFIGTCL